MKTRWNRFGSPGQRLPTNVRAHGIRTRAQMHVGWDREDQLNPRGMDRRGVGAGHGILRSVHHGHPLSLLPPGGRRTDGLSGADSPAFSARLNTQQFCCRQRVSVADWSRHSDASADVAGRVTAGLRWYE